MEIYYKKIFVALLLIALVVLMLRCSINDMKDVEFEAQQICWNEGHGLQTDINFFTDGIKYKLLSVECDGVFIYHCEKVIIKNKWNETIKSECIFKGVLS